MNPSLIPVVDVVAKGIAVLLLAMGILSLWRGASASQRSLVWLLCFGALLLLPATMLFRPMWQVTVAEARSSVQLPAAPIPVVTAAEVAGDVAPVETAKVVGIMSRWNLLQMAAAVWVTGAALVLGWRFMGSIRLRMLSARTRRCEDVIVRRLFARVSAEVCLRRPVDLRTSGEVSVPMTWGSLKPVLLLPEEALSWSEEEVLAAMRHEMGHIKHWDHPARLLMSVVCAVYWFNPLVWIAARRWRTAQEQASDDLVVAQEEQRADSYAMQLLNAARRAQREDLLKLPVMTMAQPSTLELRLSAIMDEHKNRGTVRRAAVCMGGAGALALLTLCAGLQLQAAEPAKPAQQVGENASPKPASLQRAEGIIFPSVEFRDATLNEAVEFFRIKSRANDKDKKGVNILLSPEAGNSTARLTLSLKEVPLSEALHYTAELSGMELTADDVTLFLKKKGSSTDKPETKAPAKSAALEKAGKIILPKMQFASATPAEAVEFLNIKAREMDPDKKGVNIFLVPDKSSEGAKITLDLIEVPLNEAVRYVAELAGMEVAAEQSALYLRPKGAGK